MFVLVKFFGTVHPGPSFLPTITTGGGIMARFWESATTRLLESFSSGIMWAEAKTDLVATRTKQLSRRRPCIFLWNKHTHRRQHTVFGRLVLFVGENQVSICLILITSVFLPPSNLFCLFSNDQLAQVFFCLFFVYLFGSSCFYRQYAAIYIL